MPPKEPLPVRTPAYTPRSATRDALTTGNGAGATYAVGTAGVGSTRTGANPWSTTRAPPEFTVPDPAGAGVTTAVSTPVGTTTRTAPRATTGPLKYESFHHAFFPCPAASAAAPACAESGAPGALLP